MIQFDYNTKAKVATISGDYFDEIREHFSVKNNVAIFTKKFNRYTPSRRYAITPGGKFHIGLYPSIRKFITNSNIVTDIKASVEFNSAAFPSKVNPLISRLSLENREYQSKAVELSLKYGRGIILVGTGGGKTLIEASILDNLCYYAENKETFKALIIVPDIGLVSQTYDDFLDYKVPFTVSKWTGSNDLDLSSSVIIANAGIIHARIDANDWINYVDVLLVDEIHKNANNKMSKIISKIATPNKFGFTGTLPPDPIDQWNIEGIIGPVIYSKSGAELRSEKYIADVEVKVIQVSYSDEPEKPEDDHPTAKYIKELEFIYQNPYRQKVLTSICNNFNNNILILVNHIDTHGAILYDHLSTTLKNKKVYFIQGSVEVEEREKIKQIMENENNVVCIAISKIFSTGISINNIHMIIFAAGGKAFIRTIQSIGRGVRLHPRKSKLIVIDIADMLKYGKDHLQERIKMYNSEQIRFSTTKLVEKVLA